MEYTGSPFELKQLDDAGHIEGLLAGFNNVDHGGDKLLPGCLTKTLAARNNPLPMLLHHKMDMPIGAWREWNETSDGLYVKGALTLATTAAQEARALVKDGALTGLSIGWKPLQASHDNKGARVISEAELYEGSLVTVPMNDKTRVQRVKTFDCPDDFEELLRAGGLSGRLAKEGASAIWRIKIKQPREEATDPDLVALIQNATARLAKGGR